MKHPDINFDRIIAIKDGYLQIGGILAGEQLAETLKYEAIKMKETSLLSILSNQIQIEAANYALTQATDMIGLERAKALGMWNLRFMELLEQLATSHSVKG